MKTKPAGKHPGWSILLGLSTVIGGWLLWLSLQPFATWQALGGSLSPDGDLEALTQGVYQAAQKVFLGSGIILLLLAGSMLIWRAASQNLLARIGASINSLAARLPGDLRILLRSMRTWPPEKPDRWVLVGLMLFSTAVRSFLLGSLMMHDESYTVEAWAAGSVRTILEDYHLPNNHIFSTLLVSASIKIFGVHPWSVRLPAFIAILLLIPAGYGLARRLYGRTAALLAAGAIAFAPVLGSYASGGRGYSLYMLFTVLLLWLTARLLRQNNLVEWMVWILLGTLGFWTVPMMLYPFGAACVWILLAALFDRQARQAYGSPLRLIKYLLAGGLVTAGLVVLAYSPVLYRSGTRYLLHNSFIAPLPFADFWPTLLESRLPETWLEYTRGLGYLLPYLLAAGILLSLIFHRRVSPYPLHLLASLALWVIPLLVLRRPNGWARVWSYLYPPGFIWAAAGWYGAVRWIGERLPALNRWRKWLAPAGITLAVVWMLALGLRWNLSICPDFSCPKGNEELAVEYLAPQVTDSDLILVKSPSDAPIWYYFRQNGLSNAYFLRDRQFTRAILVVQPDTGQTVDSLLAEYALPAEWFAPASLRQLTQIGRLDIYALNVLPTVNTLTGEVRQSP